MKQNTNETLTQGLTDAKGTMTEAIQGVTNAANGYVAARTALAEGYKPESGGLVQSNGVTINDTESVTEMIAALDAAKAILKPLVKATAQRGPQAGRPEKYKLVNKDGSDLNLGDKLTGMFANQVKALRGPAYEAAISDLSTVKLIDIETGATVVDGSEMKFAPAPGKVAKAA